LTLILQLAHFVVAALPHTDQNGKFPGEDLDISGEKILRVKFPE
jgi:hypothetical protein